MAANNQLKGIILTLIGGSLWGFSGVCGQYLFESKNLNANWLTAWRLFVSGLLLIVLLAPKYKKNLFDVFSKETIISLLIFCFISVMGCQLMYFVTISGSNSAVATVLEYIAPAMVMIYMCVKAKKLPSKIQIISLIFAMLGVFFMCTGGNIRGLSLSPKVIATGILSAVCYCIYTIQSPALSSKYGVLKLLAWGHLIGSLPLLLIYHEQAFHFYADWQVLLAFFGTAILGSIVSYALYIKGCQLAGPVTSSLCACIEPLSSAVIACLWLGTRLKSTDIVGLILIVATVIVLSLEGKASKSQIN